MSYTIQYFFSVQRRIAISITSWHFDINVGINDSLSNNNLQRRPPPHSVLTLYLGDDPKKTLPSSSASLDD